MARRASGSAEGELSESHRDRRFGVGDPHARQAAREVADRQAATAAAAAAAAAASGGDIAASLEATPQGEAAVAAASAWLQPLGRKQQEPGGAATAGTAPGEAAQPRKKNKRGKRSGSQAGQTHDERRAGSRGGGSSRS